jgi:hypothetical protein
MADNRVFLAVASAGGQAGLLVEFCLHRLGEQLAQRGHDREADACRQAGSWLGIYIAFVGGK